MKYIITIITLLLINTSIFSQGFHQQISENLSESDYLDRISVGDYSLWNGLGGDDSSERIIEAKINYVGQSNFSFEVGLDMDNGNLAIAKTELVIRDTKHYDGTDGVLTFRDKLGESVYLIIKIKLADGSKLHYLYSEEFLGETNFRMIIRDSVIIRSVDLLLNSKGSKLRSI
jgi:hypothetical protein